MKIFPTGQTSQTLRQTDNCAFLNPARTEMPLRRTFDCEGLDSFGKWWYQNISNLPEKPKSQFSSFSLETRSLPFIFLQSGGQKRRIRAHFRKQHFDFSLLLLKKTNKKKTEKSYPCHTTTGLFVDAWFHCNILKITFISEVSFSATIKECYDMIWPVQWPWVSERHL